MWLQKRKGRFLLPFVSLTHDHSCSHRAYTVIVNHKVCIGACVNGFDLFADSIPLFLLCLGHWKILGQRRNFNFVNHGFHHLSLYKWKVALIRIFKFNAKLTLSVKSWGRYFYSTLYRYPIQEMRWCMPSGGRNLFAKSDSIRVTLTSEERRTESPAQPSNTSIEDNWHSMRVVDVELIFWKDV